MRSDQFGKKNIHETERLLAYRSQGIVCCDPRSHLGTEGLTDQGVARVFPVSSLLDFIALERFLRWLSESLCFSRRDRCKTI
uniref:Uncharacterized protein n=1 Tax=Caenorhabditis japonica TaxID=281687 RepID=A0A8R1ELK5_CAEJA